ncbi:DEAD box ATP-dependent RNA helicase [Anopheles darlingi]|uniref:RNA helicase n=1 Tax=Anopheles darlingi TaxID=43151 RepID=W5JAW5_ANODA|nr:DEAD box ATP-dependent RNA helicase [Anopheles darlingi]
MASPQQDLNNEEKPRTEDVILEQAVRFTEMHMSEPVRNALSKNGFTLASPIQARAVPLACCFFDLLVQAKAGTGKTLVFAIAIAEAHKPNVGFPQSLTIVPTREVAVQVEGVLNMIGAEVPKFQARSFIGGMEISVDRKNLQNCSAIVGTPGRLLHLIKSNVLNTSYIRTLVLDEADTLIDKSMREDIKKIIRALPEKRQTIICSATFYNNRDRELLKFMNEKYIAVTPKREVPMLYGIKQFVRELPEESDSVKDLMAKVVAMSELFTRIPFLQCVVFANTTAKAEAYCMYLRKAGWQPELINSGMEQRLRLKAMEDFRTIRSRMLVATNLIARGIDVDNLNLVVNADVPKDHATYLHRIGRAGRFGTHGIAVTLVSGVSDMERFRRILHDIGGNEMFVHRLPEAPGGGLSELKDIWNFAEYGNKYEKMYASQMEQEIRDRDIDQLFLKAMKMNGTSSTGQESIEKTTNGDGAPKLPGGGRNNNEEQHHTKQQPPPPPLLDDSLEKSTSDEETVVELERATNGQETGPGTKPVNGFSNGENNGVEENGNVSPDGSNSIQSGDKRVAGPRKQDSLNGNSKKMAEPDRPVPSPVNNAVDDDDDRSSSSSSSSSSSGHSPKPGPSRNGIKALSPPLQATGAELANGFTVATTNSLIEPIVLGVQQLTMNEIMIAGDESDGGSSSSSLSTNVTEKVEVGSDFNAPLARLSQIPDPRADRQIRSVDCSDLEHSSDSESNVNECPPFETNNDALFAKIMEQKELNVEQQEHQVQLHSIDGCSLEVHDDTISDRGLSRKGSVPDVVPSGISLDSSRLHNRTTAEVVDHGGDVRGIVDRRAVEELDGEEIELNSNTCGSNRGSLFEDEEDDDEVDDVEDVIQAKIPKRIRFQQQQHDSLELNSNTVGSNVGSTPEPPEMIDQPMLLPLPIPIEADPIDEPHDDMDDASSYSSEYDSDGSNSSFFDDVDRISVTSAKSTPKEAANELMAAAGPSGVAHGGAVASGSLEQIVTSNPVSVAPSPLFVGGIAGVSGVGVIPTAGPTVIPLPSNPPVIPVSNAPLEEETVPQRAGASAAPFLPTAHFMRQPNRTPTQSPDVQATALYHRTYALWSNQYWNQLTQINDYVRFSSYARRNTYRSP